ncbi:hypothetical protein [Metallosphaera hakonensis]|uniref:Uncharacterized protein n=1 Tax=Metallosphaera hakonensis JCM 8857 = DSM 7519 TaxID=1293036 RepID=A0A2U9ITH6_9CREN|nr:hypothetical protein [Metallosphaera hakonensis]AWR99334.1 hypothetical protein DFR87_05995 [Metallosphaera hakonensis JCM 8857 = DSM 7519]
MEANTDELRKFLEGKIASLKKELEYYEYLLSMIESGYIPNSRGGKVSLDYIKSRKGEIIGEIYFSPPSMRVLIKKRLVLPKSYMNAMSKILEDTKNTDKIEYNIVLDKEELKEISITGVKEELLYNRVKAALQSILERASS